MRILFVGHLESVHTARWINQLRGLGWDIHLFPIGHPTGQVVHPDLRDLTVHMNDFMYQSSARLDESVRVTGTLLFSKSPRVGSRATRLARLFRPLWNDRAWQLARTIRSIKPDLIHSMEIQQAGYLTLDARRHIEEPFPTWIVANWGSDIFLYGRLSEHVDRIKAVLAACDYYNCECQRDVRLAREFGFKGEVLPVLPVTGGLDTERLRRLRQPDPSSARRLIALKGYQHYAGRALVGLRAIGRCADILQDYRIAVYSAGPEVKIAAELLAQETGLSVGIVPPSSHEDMLRLHGRARISIGLSISDSISTSLIEAMTMGSLPIQSDTGCATEWFQNGEAGLLVPPEDPEPIAEAIRRAVIDDELVDNAAEINARTITERADQAVIQPQVIAAYESIATRIQTVVDTHKG